MPPVMCYDEFMAMFTDKEWRELQETATQHYFDCTAVEFVHRFKTGSYDHQEDPVLDPNAEMHWDLIHVVGLFPGLDDIECKFKWTDEADLAATTLLETKEQQKTV